MSVPKTKTEVKPVANAAHDFSKLSAKEKIALSLRLAEEAKADASKEFDDNVNFIVSNAKSLGYSVQEVIDAVTKLLPVAAPKEKKPAKATTPFKFVNPNNPKEGYRGKGKKPQWLVDAVKGGAKQDDFLVK